MAMMKLSSQIEIAKRNDYEPVCLRKSTAKLESYMTSAKHFLIRSIWGGQNRNAMRSRAPSSNAQVLKVSKPRVISHL